jgi:NAD(P)-dependent dehydrogenase (short-subunit alcohol dehydrogenase family)
MNMQDLPSFPREKVAIITGANSGIGLETATFLAKAGGTVILACRSSERGLQAQTIIGKNSRFLELDLGNIASITAFSKTIHDDFPKIDLLINNAGVMHPPFTRTVDGFELTFGVNYLGHYMLTLQLLDLIQDVEHARIVNLTSIAANRPKVLDLENLNTEKGYKKHAAYGTINLLKLMFAITLNEKLSSNGHTAISIAAHPGVARSNLTRHMPFFVKPLISPFIMSTHRGTIPILHAALSGNVHGGESWGVDGWREMSGYPTLARINPLAIQAEFRAKAWTLAKELTGIDLV